MPPSVLRAEARRRSPAVQPPVTKETRMSKGTILVVGSSADTFLLREGRTEPVGYYLNELAIPMQAVVAAGYHFVLATPRGNRPLVDRHSMVAAHFDGSEAALAQALEFVATYPAMQHPRTIRSVIDEGLDDYLAVFLPGGHPPMIDLMQDADLGEVLRHFHEESKITALLCHAPIAAVAAMPRAQAFRQAMVDGDVAAAQAAAEGWQYAGYRMTVFSNEEEHYAERALMNGGLAPFYVADALHDAGGQVEHNGFFRPNIVIDRELITGQNPPSDHGMALALVRALERRVAVEPASEIDIHAAPASTGSAGSGAASSTF
jgi:putative intracellular protease/amidase